MVDIDLAALRAACVSAARLPSNEWRISVSGRSAVTMLAYVLEAAQPVVVLALLDRLEKAEAERDEYKAAFDAELAGNAVLRKRFGAREHETMAMWIARMHGPMRCDQCGAEQADWQEPDAWACPNSANPHGSCDGRLV